MSYGYDDGGRLNQVGDGTHTATYAFHTNSGLLDTVTLNSALQQNDVYEIEREYDYLGRLTDIENPAGQQDPSTGFPSDCG